MQFKSRIKNLSLAAIIGCVALLSAGPSVAQQSIAPTATLEVAPATVVDAQPNYVMEQPLPPRETLDGGGLREGFSGHDPPVPSGIIDHTRIE